jgi:hypothetical protein
MTARRIDEVTPGFYRYRRVKGGPWLPAHVTLEGDMIYVVESEQRLRIGIAAKTFEDLVVNAVMDGKAFNSNLLRVIWFGTVIEEPEYRKLLDTLAWAREHQPDHPMLNPDKPIKLREVRVSSIF